MEIEITIRNFHTDSETDFKRLSSFYHGFNIKVDGFFVGRLKDGSYYWCLRLDRGDLKISVFSIDFALVRNITEDIAKVADFFYSKYNAELPFPRYEPHEENYN